ncbi:mechanosensitive ion channel family protein [Synechococcus sp. CS-1324]|uniref:mechanosensitive ion channel family protein n=1 Tax=unclassified Synechococcus TaxID=2626047 RepID=UPI000DB2E9B3|nr:MULTISPECIES: mechanosensitive ion channel family protein [unclassified Synechococcus]MCT0213513.1 mechanosensitive ion channel family protein [Synechococcus sp. CS-1326]MCT0229613.1 mechanosensitive ion channel family protein [Synechococcus sp. CS-1324]MCT0234670.1 mechanosensitive ion channel family protein [Synechococcus sp. CS-1327]PZV03157.1 MAG: mechanosensitive ion channel protein MscS [Cyanobium sp.]
MAAPDRPERTLFKRARWQRQLLALLLGIWIVSAGAPSPAKDPASPPAGSGCAEEPAWITLDGRRIAEVRGGAGVQSARTVAKLATERLTGLANDYSFNPADFVLREDPPYTILGIERDGQFSKKMAFDDRIATCFGLSRQALAADYRDSFQQGILRYRQDNSLVSWLRGTGLALLVLGIYILWLRFQLGLNRTIRGWLTNSNNQQRLCLRIAGNQVLDSSQVRPLLLLVWQASQWALLLLVSYLLIPLLLGFFPPTQAVAAGLRGQVLGVVGRLIQAMVAAIPGLLSIALILAITVLVIRASNAWFKALEHGTLRIPGFYTEWASPTARLASVFIALIGLAVAFPYLPGSGSKAFQGAGLLLGLLAALGSSAVATNIISGLMLIYTRAYKEGDRVEINGVVGVVQDRALLVTRLQTPRNELVSIPNATVIGASVVNYSFSRREIQQPVALATTITIGYDVPWRQVHALMLAAAGSVEGISSEINPFVLQTSLNDFHISYELTAFIQDPDSYRQSLSALLGALQDQFAAANVEILSPGYHAIRNGNRSTVPISPTQPS